uniref:non-specific serine/threonine protein kinase n=1 Tax=Ananas comosus var. bracteatus TaxID=296719 RepID=A0A6V7QW31_ANACO
MELDLDKVRAIRVLGRGAMGTVFLVADRSSSSSSSGLKLFAMKVFEKGWAKKPGADRRARWEVSVLSRLSHPFLPRLVAGPVETPELLAWGLPFCPGGDLNALRHSLSDRVFSPSAIRFYLAELVSALAHLHSLGIVYRDLKPENILLGADGHVTLTDFDLSRHLHRSPKTPAPAPSSSPLPAPPRSSHRRNLTRILFASADPHGAALKKARSARVSPVSRRRTSFETEAAAETERSHSFVGTEEYVSPEVVRGEGHEFAVDWWALGILTYEMAFGRTPFRGRNRKETFRNVLTRHPEFPASSAPTSPTSSPASSPRTPPAASASAPAPTTSRPTPSSAASAGTCSPPSPGPLPPPLDDLDHHLLSPADGFDVRDYFKRLRDAPPPPPSDTPLDSSASSSLTDF